MMRFLPIQEKNTLMTDCVKALVRSSGTFILIHIIVLFLCLSTTAVRAEDQGDTLFHEDFASLDAWEQFTFPKIERHSSYSIVREGSASYLKAESKASASALLYKTPFDINRYHKVRWRWKIENVYEKGNASEKKGDDYPLRVYIIFEYNPDDATFGERITYVLAKTLYGKYPPHSSLNYIWGNKPREKKIITSTYTDRAKMIVMESGEDKAKTWVDEEVDIMDDYTRAFGKPPPSTASIAIMNDSDNTGEASISYMDFIEVYR